MIDERNQEVNINDVYVISDDIGIAILEVLGIKHEVMSFSLEFSAKEPIKVSVTYLAERSISDNFEKIHEHFSGMIVKRSQ